MPRQLLLSGGAQRRFDVSGDHRVARDPAAASAADEAHEQRAGRD
ncbi:MAG TPA: hypothetical protein VKH20_03150 [Solirubrobacterales bacterium]|nr:hypothetical protein [Solirubrobacterales bacterium]